MLDLETMSSGNNAAIVAIGAVMFDATELETLRPFYQTVDLESCQKWGLEISGSTVMWWLEQDEAARKALKENPAPRPLEEVLSNFREWFGGDKPIWGNGATFDNVILRNAYNACHMRAPWGYRSDRCYRTLKNMYPGVEQPPANEKKHHAYEDAMWQTEHLFNIYKKMKELK